ncbi:MAG: hypothetical protein HY434_00215 [Candidatus Liptonbacteria bacterium]|nr:hypothetical protein [Candidatus Liptonbacteria bacterium]
MEGGKRFETEHHPENETVFENKELGVSYKETVTELPQHRREETGVVRIKRRELLTFPEGFFGKTQKYEGRPVGEEGWKDPQTSPESIPVWEFITDDKFPSGAKMAHYIDIHNNSGEGYGRNVAHLSDDEQKEYFRTRFKKDKELYPRSWIRHKDEGLYFQSIFPEGDMGDKRMYIKTDSGELQPSSDSDTPYGVTKMYTWESWALFRSPIRHPVYLFGADNSAFRNYCASITQNREIMSLLQKNGYTDQPTNLVVPGSPEFDEQFSEYFQRTQEYNRKHGYKDSDFELENLKKQELIRHGVPLEVKDNSARNSVEFLRLIARGISSSGSPTLLGGARTIPVVKHPEVRPLKWLHSDLAIVPTKRSLNILFFEGA